MQKLRKLNNNENVFATYGEGSGGGGGGGGSYQEPRETRMVFRSSEQGMWMANVGIFSGKVYEWLYAL